MLLFMALQRLGDLLMPLPFQPELAREREGRRDEPGGIAIMVRSAMSGRCEDRRRQGNQSEERSRDGMSQDEAAVTVVNEGAVLVARNHVRNTGATRSGLIGKTNPEYSSRRANVSPLG